LSFAAIIFCKISHTKSVETNKAKKKKKKEKKTDIHHRLTDYLLLIK